MGALRRAWSLLRTERSLWKFLWAPLAWAGFAYVALLILGWVVIAINTASLAKQLGLPPQLGVAGGTVLFAIGWLFLSGPVFLALSSLISALHWDPLGREVERLQTGRTEFFRATPWQIALDVGLRLPFAAFLLLAIILFGWTFLGVPALLLAGFLALSDFAGPPMMRRGQLFPMASIRAVGMPGATGFILASGALALVPFVAVLMHPLLATAATLMAVDMDQRSVAKELPKD